MQVATIDFVVYADLRARVHGAPRGQAVSRHSKASRRLVEALFEDGEGFGGAGMGVDHSPRRAADTAGVIPV